MKINRKTAAAAAVSALLAFCGASVAAAEPVTAPSEKPTEQEHTPATETTSTGEPSPTGTAEPSAPADENGGDGHGKEDGHEGHEHHDDGDRKTYGWEPSKYDTCPASLHDEYTVTGPDGKRYDSWHPTSAVDPATGKKCTFGHEHGDDPRTSDIYEWAVKKTGDKATGIPFSYANEVSAVAAEEHGSVPHRHEDHYGHKFIVRNNVKQVRADRAGYARDASGNPIECDYLMKVHQGSHSKDALSNNAHELFYAVRCSDGTEMAVTTLTPFGQPNEYIRNCTDEKVQTSGSDLPGANTGARRIPDEKCLNANVLNGPNTSDVWGLYELWESDTTITDPSGKTIARFDPWFGVRNPSRFASGSESKPVSQLFDKEKTVGWPWSTMSGVLDQKDPASPFNGAQRDVYVQYSTVDNRGGSEFIYTDAYGRNSSASEFTGSIRQYVSTTSNTSLPELERRAFGFNTDYGAPGTGVHAPN